MGFISKSILEDILSFNHFPDREQLSDPQNEALFGILNREDARLRHLTDWPWKINHIPVPSRSFPRIIFKRVSLSKVQNYFKESLWDQGSRKMAIACRKMNQDVAYARNTDESGCNQKLINRKGVRVLRRPFRAIRV